MSASLQMPRSARATSRVPSAVHDVLRSSGGHRLDPGARASMEQRFGHDFSQVRVHSDSKASDSAKSVGARAYTVGQDVVFANGNYAPSTQAGQRLLAHELSHVIQQSGSTDTRIGAASPALEAEAERAGDAAVSGHGRVDVRGRGGRNLALAPETKQSPSKSKHHYSNDEIAQIELAEARKTYVKSVRTAQSFTAFGLTGRGTLERVATENTYWFAKLYEIITWEEIANHDKFKYPGFVLHFIPIFYDLYYNALQHYLKREFDKVGDKWLKHFNASSKRFSDSPKQYLDDITESVVSGVSAHINGDMSNALVETFTSFRDKYSVENASFNDFKNDFFVINYEIFKQVQADFVTELAKSGPFPLPVDQGRLAIGIGQKITGAGLDVDTVFRWREDAWQKALQQLGR